MGGFGYIRRVCARSFRLQHFACRMVYEASSIHSCYRLRMYDSIYFFCHFSLSLYSSMQIASLEMTLMAMSTIALWGPARPRPLGREFAQQLQSLRVDFVALRRGSSEWQRIRSLATKRNCKWLYTAYAHTHIYISTCKDTTHTYRRTQGRRESSEERGVQNMEQDGTKRILW